MKIEIALTQKLSTKLNLNSTLTKCETCEPDVNIYYADLIKIQKDTYVILLNTLTNWIFFVDFKEFKEDKLKNVKKMIYNMLLHEGVQDYIAKAYANDIDEISLSKTNNRSFVSRLSLRKQDVTYIYNNFICVPSIVSLNREAKFNNFIIKHPYISKDYIVPSQEMGKYLRDKYMNPDIEKEMSDRYEKLLNEYNFDINKINNYSTYTKDDLDKVVSSLVGDDYFLINTNQIMLFYNENKNPSLTDYLSFISKMSEYARGDEEKLYLKLFNIDNKVYEIYKSTHHLMYISAKL